MKILLLLAACAINIAAAKHPNVILTDDQGYGDIAAHGNPILKTPNLDRLTVGGKTETFSATHGTKEGSFDFMLEKDQTIAVKAELLDSSGKRLVGGYYVYCRLANP